MQQFIKIIGLGDVKNDVPPKALQCSTITHPNNVKSTFPTSPLSYASIDVFLSHTDSFKSSFATFSEWVFFLGDPLVSVNEGLKGVSTF